MQILTLENKTFVLNKVPDEIDDDFRFAVLDNSNPQDPDYFFIPLIFLQKFDAQAYVLKIGEHIIRMPSYWQILIGDQSAGDLEVVPLTSINDRGFEAFIFNPLKEIIPRWEEVEIMEMYDEVTWYFPKINQGQMLAIPLTEGDNPPCVFFVESINRTSEVVDASKLW